MSLKPSVKKVTQLGQRRWPVLGRHVGAFDWDASLGEACWWRDTRGGWLLGPAPVSPRLSIGVGVSALTDPTPNSPALRRISVPLSGVASTQELLGTAAQEHGRYWEEQKGHALSVTTSAARCRGTVLSTMG